MDDQDNNFNYTQYEEADSEGVEEELPSPVRRGPTRAILIFLACSLVILLVGGLVPRWQNDASFWAKEVDGYYEVQYEWAYKGLQWRYDAQIPKETYLHFKRKGRTPDYKKYVLDPDDDELMNDLAIRFSDEAEQKGWGESETVSFVLSFIQNMPYTKDEVTTGHDEWPRYPVETMVDGGGDCEDTAILFTSIVREMGYGVALLKLAEDQHMAAGVLISQDVVDNWRRHHDYPLTYYTKDGKHYAYCETTGRGWELGHKPDELISLAAEVIDVS